MHTRGGETTTDSFTYTANDAVADSNAATVTVTITPVNDAPVANDDSATTAEDTAVTVAVLSNDGDVDDDPLSVAIATAPSQGIANINPNGTIVYKPAADFNGSDSFTYVVSDGVAKSNVATVAVTVSPVNDAPVATDDSATTIGTRPVTINVLSNDTDVEGDELTVTGVPSPAAKGTVTISADGTSVTYTASVGFDGTEAFTYTVSDGNGGTDTGTVTLTVTDPLLAAKDAVRRLTGVNPALQRSLQAKVDAIFALLERGDSRRACVMLQGFILQVNALPNRQLSADQKATLVELAGLVQEEHCGP